MKTTRKTTYNQTLNPFLGFGWYTGMNSHKRSSDLTFKSCRKLEVVGN